MFPMYVLSFRNGDTVATSEKPISLLEARKAYTRWHTHNKCPLISLEILPVGDAPPFTPGDVDGVNYVEIASAANQTQQLKETAREDAPA
jgi:hypothetical protein